MESLFFIPGSSLNAHEETLSDNHVCQISGGWNSDEAGRENEVFVIQHFNPSTDN